ncbi:membrane protein [Gordonia Phage Odesza]|uniref:Membrane protein n=1 Tax=Gordonia Phage Odesza TaxID=2656527 RepID=A0A649VC43_9CAUD|nr:membrane protein [Gordonia Phage Odesza]
MLNNIIANAKNSKALGSVLVQVQKSSPNTLFAAGIVGVVGTVVLSSKATLKAVEVNKETKNMLEQINGLEHDDYSDKDRVRDKAVLYSQTAVTYMKLYAPTLVVGTLSIACLTQSHRVLTQRNMALGAAYAGVEKALNGYRERVIAEVGPEREAKIWQPVEKVDVIDAEGKKSKIEVATEEGGSPYKVLFDESNVNWNKAHEYNQLFLNAQQNYANDLLRAKGHVFLNDVHDMLGLPRTKAGQIVGWVMDGEGDNYIDFGFFRNIHEGMRFVAGDERSIWLDFNVDGNVLELL